MIYAVGLGYARDDVSVKGKKLIKGADSLFVKSLLSPAGRALKRYAPRSFDELFERADDFAALYAAMADELAGATGETVVYCTDGTGRDRTVAELLRRGVSVTVVPGGVDAAGLTVSAADLAEGAPYIDTLADLTVTELDDRLTAGAVKLVLLRFYAAETVCEFQYGDKCTVIELQDLDRQKKYGVQAAVRIAGSDALDKTVAGFGDLLRVMERLTAPDGCPWDRAQTHESIRQNMIEEAYEAVDAIDAQDADGMIEEFGDVIMQAVFHANIADRNGAFDISDVLSGLCRKLYTRHTHIFGADHASDAGEALTAWEAAKAKEKQYESLYDILCRLPKGFRPL